MKLYTARNLIKKCAGKILLNIDHLEIESGLIYGLSGPNGAGKTTLLGILGFLDQPTGGSIKFCGQHVQFNESTFQFLRKKVVVVDQYPVLFTRSVYKNIEFGLKIRKIDRQTRERLIDEVLELVDMQSFKFTPAPTLSGGETQRIALARALVLRPEVLLCDEPTASVDIENQAAITAILKEINKSRKITIIFTSHNQRLISELSDRTLVLSEGRLVTTNNENIFHCRVEKLEREQVRCHLSENIYVDLPEKHSAGASGKCRILIHPEKISLAPISTQSPKSFPGKVLQLMLDGQHIRAVVDIGLVLTIFMTQNHYGSFSPAIGDTVSVSIDLENAITLVV